MRSTLTSFANKFDGTLGTQGFAETDVRLVMARFPELGDRDVSKTKYALNFSSFANGAKSKDPVPEDVLEH